MKLSVLVAWRDPGNRQAVWEYVQSRYARFLPDAEICVGTDDGVDPFHKTLALNRAAERASGDVYMVADADSWAPSSSIEDGLRAVQDGHWVRPWNLKLKIGQLDTGRVLENSDWNGEVDDWMNGPRRMENLNTYWAAPPIMMSRDQFEAVGGLDERFRGWGQEDEAFALTLRALFGRQVSIRGYCVHLFHDRIGRSGHDLWNGQEDNTSNLKLIREYQRAVPKGATAMQQVIGARNG